MHYNAYPIYIGSPRLETDHDGVKVLVTTQSLLTVMARDAISAQRPQAQMEGILAAEALDMAC